MESGFLGMFRWLEMFMADCLASKMTSVFRGWKRKSTSYVPINSQRRINCGGKKLILTAQITGAESSHCPPQAGECRVSESATHSLLHRPHRGLTENINGGHTPHMEVRNVRFSQPTDDGQFGWVVDGCTQQPHQAASVCSCAKTQHTRWENKIDRNKIQKIIITSHLLVRFVTSDLHERMKDIVVFVAGSTTGEWRWFCQSTTGRSCNTCKCTWRTVLLVGCTHATWTSQHWNVSP